MRINIRHSMIVVREHHAAFDFLYETKKSQVKNKNSLKKCYISDEVKVREVHKILLKLWEIKNDDEGMRYVERMIRYKKDTRKWCNKNDKFHTKSTSVSFLLFSINLNWISVTAQPFFTINFLIHSPKRLWRRYYNSLDSLMVL